MTSLNALPPLPSCSTDPIGTSSATGESAPPGVRLDADDPSDFLQVLLAYLPLDGSRLKDPISTNDVADSVPSPSTEVAELSPNTDVPTSGSTDETVAEALTTTNGEAFARDLALEAKLAFKKMMATAPNSPGLAVADPAPQPIPVVSPISSDVVGKVAVQDKAGTNLLVENEQAKRSAQPSMAHTTVEQPIALDRAAEATAKSGVVPMAHMPTDGHQPEVHGPIQPAAIPARNTVEELTKDLGSADHSVADEVHSSAAAEELTDTDAEDSDASIAPAESKRLTNDHANASIARRDEARPTTLADKVHDTFQAHLDQVRQQGRVEVQMDLHPPELGRMQLHITMQDNQLSVRLVVQNDAAKQVLDQQLDPLRIRFAEMGVSLGQLDVRRDSNAPNQQAPSDSERSSGSVQSGQNAANRLRSSYAQARNSSALVDVIA